MKLDEVQKVIMVNNILAEWDPLGCHLHDARYAYSEYINYVSEIINTYEDGHALYDYLAEMKLKLFGVLDESSKSEISNIAEKIVLILKP